MSVMRYTAMEVPPLGWAQASGSLGVPLDGTTAFSVDAWVKFDGLSPFGGVLDQDGGFAFGTMGAQLLFQIPGLPAVTSSPSRPLGERDWHHVCATYDGSTVRLYIDGLFDSATGVRGSGSSVGKPWRFGAGLQGLLRSVRVFNVPLTADQVLANLFGAPPAGTVTAAFDFTQSPPVDSGPGRLPITLQAGARIVTRTPGVELRDRAYVHPLVEEGVNPGGLQVDPYTVQSWVYVDPAANPLQVIFTNSDLLTDTGMSLLALVDDDDPTALRLVSTRGSVATEEPLISTQTFPGRRWTNVATTFDGTTLGLFIDGQPAGTMAAGPIPLMRDLGDPMIGGSHTEDEPLADWTLQGWIARLEVWDRTLTAAEIVEASNAPPDPLSPGLRTSYDFSGAPVRDAVDSHPVGLVDDARLTAQVTPGAVAEELLADAFAGYEPLDDDVLAGLVAGVELGEEPVLLTHHVVDGERILLLHSERGVHLAYRGSVDDIDPCTMWKIELVFAIVAGLLSVVFAVYATLSPRAIAMIQRLLRNPRVAAALSLAGKITATGILAFFATVYDSGSLGELLRALLVDAGFFLILRVVGRVIALATGFGVAEVLVALAGAVAMIVVAWQRRPASCDPPPQVQLSAIKFNWDPTSASTDALSIRRNWAVSGLSPEWASTSPAGSAAAYAISSVTGKTPIIQAKFVLADPTTQQATIQATGGGPLGAIDPIVVTFKNGVSDPEWVPIPLPHHTLPTGGVRAVDATWAWTVTRPGESPASLATTTHRVYVTLNPPTEPWVQPPYSDLTQLPWTEALEYACTWAAGQTTEEGVQTAITTAVNGAVGLRYDTSSGASAYTANGFFLLTQFLAKLKGGTGRGAIVNCTDCATIVTTFANLVGSNVFAWRMSSTPYARPGFLCNKIQAIGYATWAYPFNGYFSYHEVVWTGAAGLNDLVWDACLKYDSGPDPWDWTSPTHTAALPTAIPFTTQTTNPPPLPMTPPLTASTYRERLARNEAGGIGQCVPYGPPLNTNSGRRRLQ